MFGLAQDPRAWRHWLASRAAARSVVVTVVLAVAALLAIALYGQSGSHGRSSAHTTAAHGRSPSRAAPSVASLAQSRIASSCPARGGGSGSPRGRSSGGAAGPLLIRVNQVGYVLGCPKQAEVMSVRALSGAGYAVMRARGGGTVLRGRLGASRGAFNARWRHVYRVDLSALRRSGTYAIQLPGHRSGAFRVDSAGALYRGVAAAAVSFFGQQRDGPQVSAGVLRRQPSHLRDRTATVYATPFYRGQHLQGTLHATGIRVDVSGGWADAGDYLKLVETASFSDALMYFTLRQYPQGVADPGALAGEARFGSDWLLKMWDPVRRVLYYQVGIGDGNGGRIRGDHDLWRLPQADDRRRTHVGAPAYYETYRPVFAANAPGRPISPNLAGRTAAALALAAQTWADRDPAYALRCLTAAQVLYDQADTHPRGKLMTTSPYSYYDEHPWQDDMALGADELYLATLKLAGRGALPHADPGRYLTAAGHWVNAFTGARTLQNDALNLYDVSGLADYELIAILHTPQAQQMIAQSAGVDVPTDSRALLADRRQELVLAARLSAHEPFGLADPATTVDTVPHALGYAIQARLYDEQARTGAYEPLAQNQLDWVLGANAWGSSFVVGAGQVFPRCLAHQVANLSGSLGGRGRILRGATVDGPTTLADLRDLGAPDGHRPCPGRSVPDPFAGLRGRHTGYLDDVRSSSTSEPADDYTALTLLAAAQQAAGG